MCRHRSAFNENSMNSTPTSLQLLGGVLSAFDMTRQDYVGAYQVLNNRKARRSREGRGVRDACDQWGAAAAMLFGVPALPCDGRKPAASEDPLIMKPAVPIDARYLGYSLHMHGIFWDRARTQIASDPSLKVAFFRYGIIHLATLVALENNPSNQLRAIDQLCGESPVRRALDSARRCATTQAALAADLEVTEETIRRWRGGAINPSGDKLMALADRAAADPEHLFWQVGVWRLAERLRAVVGEAEFESALRVFQEVVLCRSRRSSAAEERGSDYDVFIWYVVVPFWTWLAPENVLPHEALSHGGPDWEHDVRRVQVLMRDGVRPSASMDYEFVADLDQIHAAHIPAKRLRAWGIDPRRIQRRTRASS